MTRPNGTIRRRSVCLTTGALLLAGAGLGAALSPASAAETPGAELGSYSLSASAPAVQVREDDGGNCAASASGTGGCEAVIPETVATLSNGPIGFALSSVVWPGTLAGNAGTLLVVLGGDQVPPGATALNSPVRAEARTGDEPVTNSTYPGTTMKASAKAYDVTASAEVANSAATGAGTFGNTTSTSHTFVTGPKTATAEAMSTVGDVELAGGAVKIGAVTSTAKAVTDGATTKVGGTTTTSGMTIGGVPVTIDQDGVNVAGTSAPLGQTASGAVNTVVKNLGMTVTLSEPTTTSADGTTTYNAGSLIFTFVQQGNANTVVLGGSSVTVAAAPALSFDLGDTSAAEPFAPAPAPPEPLVPAADPVVDAAPEPVSEAPVELTPVQDEPATAAVPEQATPVQAVGVRQSLPLFGGIPVLLVLAGLAGVGFLAAGLRRLPDHVLEQTATTTCPLGDAT